MKKGIVVVLSILLVGLGQGYAQEAQTTVAGASAHYQCPMHPEIHQAEPGDCPECGMHLEAVFEAKK